MSEVALTEDESNAFRLAKVCAATAGVTDALIEIDSHSLPPDPLQAEMSITRD